MLKQSNTMLSGSNAYQTQQSHSNISISLPHEVSLRNDISYLSNLKNSSSLPYLKHIQIQPDEKDPLKLYIYQKL